MMLEMLLRDANACHFWQLDHKHQHTWIPWTSHKSEPICRPGRGPHGNVCVEERAKQLELCEELEVVEVSEDKG